MSSGLDDKSKIKENVNAVIYRKTILAEESGTEATERIPVVDTTASPTNINPKNDVRTEGA